jgi:peptide/nickel transport system ATP-binding protein
MEPLLSVRHLVTSFKTDAGVVRAVDDVSFDVEAGKTLAVVGESGCGKSVTALSLMRLVPSPPGEIESGEVLLNGKNLLDLPDSAMRAIRGREVAMIFQEPMTSLNPVYTVGSQIREAIRIHQDMSRREAHARAIELLDLVGIPSPAERAATYPHQLSGGMRQRVMIAMALSCNPALLLADEPTTALDVTIQAQILDLLRKLQSELRMGIVFITHDLGVVAEFAHDVVVMYAGRVVETASVRELLARPLHPYTQGLLKSLPPARSSSTRAGAAGLADRRLPTIEGMVPNLLHLPKGCRFADRCALRATEPEGYERCDEVEPELEQIGTRQSRCYYAEGFA